MKNNWLHTILIFISFQFTLLGFAQDLNNQKLSAIWQYESFGSYPESMELSERRSMNEKHFQRIDGKVDMFVSSEPINYLENGTWKTIYNSIQEESSGPYKYSNTSNIFKSYYPENIQTGFKTKFEEAEMLEMQDARMYYELNGEKLGEVTISYSKGISNNNALIYSGVYGNGIDLLVTQEGGKRKLDYIIQNREVLNGLYADADYLVFSEGIVLPEGWSAKMDHGSILLIDKTGEVVSLYEMPIVFDKNESDQIKTHSGNELLKGEFPLKRAENNGNQIVEKSNIEYELILDGRNLTILTKVKMEYLLNENRFYPVWVDPTLTASIATITTGYYYDYQTPYGPAIINTTGAPAGSAITNVNLALNVTRIQDYDLFGCLGWCANYAPGTAQCGSWHVFALDDGDYAPLVYTCGGNLSNWNCLDPNRSWRTEIWSVDGYDYRARWGFTVTVTYETVTAPTSIGTSVNPICNGSSTVLTPVGGTANAGSTAITNQWFTGSCGGTSAGTGATLTVSPATTTTYYVRRVGQCSTTACASVTVTVNQPSVAPTGITGTTTICSGGSTTLTLSGGTAGTGASAQWFAGSCGSAVIGTGNSITVSPTSNTTYFVRYNGTCNTTTCASVTVTVNQLSVAPTGITGTTTICSGGSTTLSLSGGTSGTGATAEWFTGSCGGTAAGTGNSITVSPTSNTTYFVRYNGTCNTTTCASVTVTVSTLSVAPTSISGTTTICSGSSTTLTLVGGTAGTGASAQWFTGSCGGTAAGSGNSITVSPTSNTTYFVRYSGTCNTTTCASVTVTVNALSVAPTSISGITTICSGNSTTLTLAGGTAGTGATAQWFTGSCGGTAAGTGASITVSPTSTTTYFVLYSGTCNTTSCASVTLTVNSFSTTPTIAPFTGTICPNTDYTLVAGAGTTGTGASTNWYTGPNGTGTFLGSGSSIVVAPTATTTYYARREGLCNTTPDVSATINVKSFVYATNGASTNNYCTDNAGWQHFYIGDEIIFSVQGNLSSAGTVTATIFDNGSYYQETEGPGTAPGCSSNENPNEERFEMERSWNVDYTGSLTGAYNIRFYYPPAERTAIETAANAWMAAYPDCGYGYKYPTPNGFYWFKNSGSSYTAPDYDGTQYAATVSSVSGVNYAQWTGISGFSGGSGAIILDPISVLPVTLSSFAAICDESGEEVSVRWTTATEYNTSHFDVERSLDGSNWEILGSVNAAGNSTTNMNYEMIDTDARGNSVLYYRLHQFDNDGVNEEFGPISAECLNDQIGFEIFPNPAGTDVTVLLHGDHQVGETNIVFTDINGKEVKRIVYNEQVGKLMKVDLRNLEPGVYLVRLMNVEKNTQFVRLIKQ